MSLLRKWMYYLLVIGLICTGPALLLLWKYKIEPNWGTVEVVQAVKPVQRGEVLTPDRIHIAKIPRGTLVDGAILRLSDALNRETVRAIRVNEQLTPDMVNARHLLPGPGEWNMPPPSEWIFGKPPGSLLRGDRVSLLLVTKENAEKAESRGEPSRDKLAEWNIPYEEEAKLKEITVSYAKGANNQEIAASEDRKKPNGAVNTVELIVTDEQKELIRKYGMKGYRFLIVYR
ncbi:SAF domain-containing protein [Paenibacillus sp. P25]|nr:SAF domain-containing protein [Paenibacillus sp. P25]